jgi:NADH dehydrogenase
MKVFITGGTGFVGRPIVEELQNRGHELVALVRRIGSVPGAGEILGDVTRPETFPLEKLAGCQAAIHLVGIIREFPQKGITFKRVHVDGTRNVLEACQKAGITRFLHQSALGWGYRSGALYQRTKARAEELVKSSKLNWTIFRPSTILGQDGEFTKMMQGMIRLGIIPLPGNGNSLMEPVTVSTVAQAFANALERDTSISKIYDLGGDTVSYRLLLNKIASQNDRNPVFVKIPQRPLSVLAGWLDTFPFFPITQEQLIMLQEKAFPTSDVIYRELDLEYKGIERVLEEVLSG